MCPWLEHKWCQGSSLKVCVFSWDGRRVYKINKYCGNFWYKKWTEILKDSLQSMTPNIISHSEHQRSFHKKLKCHQFLINDPFSYLSHAYFIQIYLFFSWNQKEFYFKKHWTFSKRNFHKKNYSTTKISKNWKTINIYQISLHLPFLYVFCCSVVWHLKMHENINFWQKWFSFKVFGAKIEEHEISIKYFFWRKK